MLLILLLLLFLPPASSPSPMFCQVYLEEYMHPDQLDGELLLAPGFMCPPNTDYKVSRRRSSTSRTRKCRQQ